MARSAYVYVLCRSDDGRTVGAWTVKRELGQYLNDVERHGECLIPYYIVRYNDGITTVPGWKTGVFVSVRETMEHAKR